MRPLRSGRLSARGGGSSRRVAALLRRGLLARPGSGSPRLRARALRRSALRSCADLVRGCLCAAVADVCAQRVAGAQGCATAAARLTGQGAAPAADDIRAQIAQQLRAITKASEPRGGSNWKHSTMQAKALHCGIAPRRGAARRVAAPAACRAVPLGARHSSSGAAFAAAHSRLAPGAFRGCIRIHNSVYRCIHARGLAKGVYTYT